MSAYAISLLMDRQLLIKITPCELSKYLEPNEIDWSIDHIPNYENLTKETFYISYNDRFVKNGLKNINFLNFKNQTNVILYRDGFNLIKHLTLNSNHHEKIKSLGYSLNTFNIEQLFYDAYRKLFKFNKNLDRLFNTMLRQAKPNRNTKLICAQIRTGDDGSFQFMARNDTRLFWRFIQNEFTPKLNDYKIFITTDKSSVIDEAIQMFGNGIKISITKYLFH